VNQPYVGPCDAVTINPPSSDGGLFTVSEKFSGVMLRISDSGRAAAKAGLTRCLPTLNNPRLKARGCLAGQDVALKPAISRTFAWLQTPRQAFSVNFGTIFPKFHAFLGI
ncbi:hypothetical protein, partial [uncultured Duodenibacillus sp.]|uniref:hypothetical protein n=1 Tax=uncultured Duodenibacillus sp. TaxID=1980699 RepID=UPI002596C0B4